MSQTNVTHPKGLRVLHVSLFRKAGTGHRAQLSYEVAAATELREEGICDWTTESWVSTTGSDVPVFEQLVPRPFRHPRVAPLFLWGRLIRQHKHYDFVLLRYPMPDFFSWLLAPFVKNLVTVHHTKEIEELEVLQKGLTKRVALFIERKLQPIAFRRITGLIGVTDEIRKYELQRLPKTRHSLTAPNGIRIADTIPAADLRGDDLQVAFVASQFYDWHGLDLLLAELSQSICTSLPATSRKVVLHLIGTLTAEQQDSAASLRSGQLDIRTYGSLGHQEIASILARCHLALGSLALFRNGMEEACTLKAREYLSSGVPVYATHRDAALPQSFPYYLHEETLSFERIVSLAEQTREIKRSEIASESASYIDKTHLMRRQIEELTTWLDA